MLLLHAAAVCAVPEPAVPCCAWAACQYHAWRFHLQFLLVRRLAPPLLYAAAFCAMHEADVLHLQTVRGPPLPGLLGIFTCSLPLLQQLGLLLLRAAAFCALRGPSVLLLHALRGPLACACSAAVTRCTWPSGPSTCALLRSFSCDYLLLHRFVLQLAWARHAAGPCCSNLRIKILHVHAWGF
jgi:hypothetical protein